MFVINNSIRFRQLNGDLNDKNSSIQYIINGLKETRIMEQSMKGIEHEI